MNQSIAKPGLFHPSRWGLDSLFLEQLPSKLLHFWQRYRVFFKNRTRDPSEHAYTYLRGLLTLDTHRTFANIERRVYARPHATGENIQHFISNSPWSAASIFAQIRQDIIDQKSLHGGVLIIDDSGDDCSGSHRAGAAPQYIGRLGKIEDGVVGVSLTYFHQNTHAMVDAELFLPKKWFTESHEAHRKQCEIPEHRRFQKKNELAFELVARTQESGLPFEVVLGDGEYGKKKMMRTKLGSLGLTYFLEVNPQERVYLEKPEFEWPSEDPHQVGRPRKWVRVVSEEAPVQLQTLLKRGGFEFEKVEVRQTERGLLSYECAARRVWVVDKKGGAVREEWAFVWRKGAGSYSFSMSNAEASTKLEKMAWWRSVRYFVERTYQDEKSELGWADLEAQKYKAWYHHTALCALALWFIQSFKLELEAENSRDKGLKEELKVEKLPGLSVANIRELLKTALPLPVLSLNDAIQLVIHHLVGRCQATASRLRKQQKQREERGEGSMESEQEALPLDGY